MAKVVMTISVDQENIEPARLILGHGKVSAYLNSCLRELVEGSEKKEPENLVDREKRLKAELSITQARIKRDEKKRSDKVIAEWEVEEGESTTRQERSIFS